MLGIRLSAGLRMLRWHALLLSCALLSAQTLALEHLHIEDSAAEVCVICVHGDTPAAVQHLPSLPAPSAGICHAHSLEPVSGVVAAPLYYFTRAPPTT